VSEDGKVDRVRQEELVDFKGQLIELLQIEMVTFQGQIDVRAGFEVSFRPGAIEEHFVDSRAGGEDATQPDPRGILQAKTGA